jgi:hypothetical protein
MLQNLKLLLGLDESDTSLDAKLSLLLTMTTARLKLLLGGIEPPESMEHIITEVAVIRFNRIGSEGVASHSVEGESLQFTDGDFDGFADEIQAFLDSQKESTRGRVRFL